MNLQHVGLFSHLPDLRCFDRRFFSLLRRCWPNGWWPTASTPVSSLEKVADVALVLDHSILAWWKTYGKVGSKNHPPNRKHDLVSIERFWLEFICYESIVWLCNILGGKWYRKFVSRLRWGSATILHECGSKSSLWSTSKGTNKNMKHQAIQGKCWKCRANRKDSSCILSLHINWCNRPLMLLMWKSWRKQLLGHRKIEYRIQKITWMEWYGISHILKHTTSSSFSCYGFLFHPTSPEISSGDLCKDGTRSEKPFRNLARIDKWVGESVFKPRIKEAKLLSILINYYCTIFSLKLSPWMFGGLSRTFRFLTCLCKLASLKAADLARNLWRLWKSWKKRHTYLQAQWVSLTFNVWWIRGWPYFVACWISESLWHLSLRMLVEDPTIFWSD